MKKSLLIALFGAASVAAYGQGQMLFDNYIGTSSQVVRYTAGLNGGTTIGTEFNVGLLYFIGTSALDVAPNTGAMTAFNGGAPLATFGLGSSGDGGLYAGWFNALQITIPGVTAGTAGDVSFVVEAFNGSSYANSTIRGQSTIFNSPVSNGSGPTPDMGNTIPNNSGTFFTVAPVGAVPEPSSLALAGLGGFGMLMAFRRKKA
jgi:hypothetical protein